MSASGLQVVPSETVDPTKPADAEVQVVTDASGRSQVRLQATPADTVDPNAPKPEDKKADEPKPTDRPSWLPEKFATPDAMKEATIALAKAQGAPSYVVRGLETSESGQEVSDAYKEFEKKIDPNSGKPAEQKVEEKPKVEDKKDEPYVKPAAEKAQEKEIYGEYVANLLEKAGVSGQAMGEEFGRTGKIEEATYVKFEKQGVSRQFLDHFMGSVNASANQLAQTHINDLKTSVGGEEKFSEMTTWAKANMSKEDIGAYNVMVSSGSLAVAKRGVEWFNSEFKKASGTPPKLVTDTKPGSTKGEVYESWDQVKVDMADKRYKDGDPAFHAKVAAKLTRSNL